MYMYMYVYKNNIYESKIIMEVFANFYGVGVGLQGNQTALQHGEAGGLCDSGLGVGLLRGGQVSPVVGSHG